MGKTKKSTSESSKGSKTSKGDRRSKTAASKKSTKLTPSSPAATTGLSEELKLPQGPVDLASLDARATPGYPGVGKQDAPTLTQAMAGTLSDLQERLFAAGRSTPEKAPRVLMVLQGMDTSGKGGVIRHAIGMVDPQGVALTSFKAPTDEELAHHFLWRIKNALPGAGMIGIFDRSHYEDVLIGKVNQLATPRTIASRYAQINRFEQELVDSGVTVIKCFLQVSKDEQLVRLNERLDNPEKYWKYNPGDVDARARWDAYQEAYAVALEKCNTEAAPWFVIPSDRKWYRNWAAARLLLEHLEALDLGWPEADFEVAVEKERLNSLT